MSACAVRCRARRTRSASGEISPSGDLLGGYRVMRHAFALLRNRPQRLGSPDHAPAHERQTISRRWAKAAPLIQSAMTLVRLFLTTLRSGEGAQMDRWLDDASRGPLPELRRCTAGLRAVLNDFRAAVLSGWSGRQVKALPNRMKVPAAGWSAGRRSTCCGLGCSVRLGDLRTTCRTPRLSPATRPNARITASWPAADARRAGALVRAGALA